MFGVPTFCVFVVRFSERYFGMCWDVGGNYYWTPESLFSEKVGDCEIDYDDLSLDFYH